jgi:hypothetical protein
LWSFLVRIPRQRCDGLFSGAGGFPGANLRRIPRAKGSEKPLAKATAAWVAQALDRNEDQQQTQDERGEERQVGLPQLGHQTIVALYVPKTSSTSCDQAIFVDQATDASAFSYAVLVEVDRLRQWFQRGGCVQGAVRPCRL